MFDDLIDQLGQVILQTEPYVITADPEEVEKRLADRENQIGFWKELFDEWEKEGRI